MTVNLFSDTQTVPTPAMLRAMVEAEVGDEQRGTDPTVNALQERVAELLGHEAAVFLPSGTMCNAIAVRLHVRPGGDEIILHEFAHAAESECGGPAALSGAIAPPARTTRTGIFTPAPSRRRSGRPSRYAPRSRLVIVEQTTNLGGGRVWPPARSTRCSRSRATHGLRTHLDGARLMNAAVAASSAAGAVRGRIRHRLDRLREGARLPVRSRAGRLPRADRGGLAVQADVGRRDAPGRVRRRRLPLRARPQRRSSRRGSRAREAPRRGARADPGRGDRPERRRDEHRHLRRPATLAQRRRRTCRARARAPRRRRPPSPRRHLPRCHARRTSTRRSG